MTNPVAATNVAATASPVAAPT
ncbi:MAG: hypothetical protein QOD87_1018, partial [Pseudonocardiales bacterium]|nr:hypothetical protein [Pseudonocardiales bacterium]